MAEIASYVETKNECDMLELRLKLLIDDREEIWQKYFGVKSPQFDKVSATESYDTSDKMVKYLAEVDGKPIYNGYTLNTAIERVSEQLERKKAVLNEMDNILSRTDTIEGKLFYLIVVKHIKITKAVERIANQEGYSADTIWKVYYPRVKPELHKLRKKRKAN